MKRGSQLAIIGIIGALIFGVSFIWVGYSGFSWDAWINQLSIDIAIIFFTVVAISVVWGLLGGDPQEKLIEKLNASVGLLGNSVNLLKNSKESGLVDFCTVSGRFKNHSEWMDMLTSSKRGIDLMGYSLHSWTYGENFASKLAGLAKQGVAIRVMIMDEENPKLDAIVNPNIAAFNVDLLKAEIQAFERVFQDILRNSAGIENDKKPVLVKVKKGIITGQLCRFDSKICITPYLYSVQTSESPLFVIDGENTELYNRYKKEFDSLWNRNHP